MREGVLDRVSGSRKVQLACVGLALACAACVIVQSMCLAFAITQLWAGASLASVIPYVAGFFAAFMARLLMAALQDRVATRFSERAASELQRAYLDALSFAGPALVHRSGHAACVLDATSGMDSIRTYLAQSIPKRASLLVVPLALSIAVACFDVLSGIITFLCLPFIMIFMRLIGHTASDDAARRHAGFAQMSNHFVDALRGLSTLRAFGRAATYGKTVFAASEGYRRHVMRTLRTATLSSTVLDIFATCGLAAVAIMLGFRMVDGDVLFFPALCVLLLVPEFFMPIRAYAQGYHATLEGKAALASVEQALLFADDQSTLEVEYESIESELDLTRALDAPGLPALKLDQVRIAHGGSAHVLSGVTADLTGAHMVVLTGPSGAGKSSLLDVLAGFANPSSGHLVVNGQRAETLKRREWHARVAYIPQRPHIFNASVRDNVALYRPAASDDEVRAALAKVGLAWLAEGPEGLELMLGECGRKLSGGEAHRIALARALADPRRDVIVLDEPTAHLDVETERALKETLGREFADKLVIMATHRLHWTDEADIHLRVENGTVCVRCDERSLRTVRGSRLAYENTREPADADHGCVGASLCASPGMTSHAQGNRLLKDLLKRNRGLAALALLLSFIAAVFACGLMFTSGYMISLAAALPVTVLALHLPSIFVRIFGVGKPLIDYVQRLSSHDWILRATSFLRQRLFEAARDAADAGRPQQAGEMLATLSDDIKSVQDVFIRSALPFVLAVLVVIGLSATAFVFSPLLGGVMLALLAAATLGCALVGLRTDERLKVEEAARTRSLFSLLTDDVIGLRDVVLSGQARERGQRVVQARNACAALRKKLDAHARARSFACQVLVCCAIVACLIWAADAFAPADVPEGMRAGGNGAVQALASYAAQNESPCPQNWIAAFAICLFPMIEFLLPATESLLDGDTQRTGIDRLASLYEAPVPSSSRSLADIPEPLDAAHAVEVELDAFAYPGMEEPLLRDISFSLAKGTSTALIGRTGAGKTTLVRAIASDLPEPVEGIRRAGTVGLIEQESYLFNKPLRENLLIAKGDATDEELERVLASVGLADLLERLPKGLDTVLASGGEDVSGGEATRIAVARALLAGFDIIIMDEPFRALDPDTEAAVMATIQEVLADKTVLIITHHLQGLASFDHVLRLSDGRLRQVEFVSEA